MAVFYNRIQRTNPSSIGKSKCYAALKRINMVREKDVAKQIAYETIL